MKVLAKCLAAASLIGSLAHAQAPRNGDLLVNVFDYTNPPGPLVLLHILEDGTLATSALEGSGKVHTGVIVTSSGLVATSRRIVAGINLYDLQTGAEVATFDTPEVAGFPGDMDRFSDGTLALVDQDGDVDLYSEAGVHLGTIGGSDLLHPFGLCIDVNDELWVGDLRPPLVPVSGYIWHFAQDGSLLDSLQVDYPPGDIAHAPDGTLWVSDYLGNVVHRYDAAGSHLGQFTTAVDPPQFFAGLAVKGDGTLVVSSNYSDSLYFHAPTGELLGETQITTGSGSPLFLSVVHEVETPGLSYCSVDVVSPTCPCGNIGAAGEGCTNSTGAGARLRSSGAAELGFDSWTLEVDQAPANRFGVYFQGSQSLPVGTAAVLGDGLRCIGGTLLRLEVVSTDGAGVASTSSVLSIAGGATMGEQLSYQFWYRDPAGPCSSGFNLSSALQMVW